MDASLTIGLYGISNVSGICAENETSKIAVFIPLFSTISYAVVNKNPLSKPIASPVLKLLLNVECI